MWWLVGLAAAGAGLAVLGLETTNTPEFPEQHLRDDPVQVIAEPGTAQLTELDKQQLLATSTKFVRTAVVHRHLREAYDLVGPDLRGGMTRAEWAKGDNPVVPFPAVGIATWAVAYSYPNDAGLDVALVAKPGSDTVGKTFRIELKRSARSAPWRVVSWLPNGISGAGNVRSIAEKQSMVAAAQPRGPRLGSWWLAFPAGLLSLALLLPVLITVRSWRAGRRAEREYRAERGLPLGGN
jgi:hypothetical protein